MASEITPFQTPDELPASVATGSRSRVLIVDDERGPRESLRMILSSHYAVSTAENGAEALDLLRTGSIDLVTVDLNMPGMKGDELMRTIRAEFPPTEIIIITGCGSIETAVEGIRHGVFDYLTKPFDVVQVTASVERALERRASRARMVSFLEDISRVLGRNRDSGLVLDELDASPLAQERLRAVLEEPVLGPESGNARIGGPSTIEFLEVLAETIESRDLFMRGHARRVAFYSDLLAASLCLSREERNHVRMAAFLHDIGKVGAASDLLAGIVMPEPKRLESIQSHPAVGEKLLLPLGLDAPIATTVRHHHERHDGAGYPDGLSGDAIPLAARIIGITDAFDAMTCERPYRRARTRDEALVELRREAGGQFDPSLIGLFCELVMSGATDEVGEAGPLSGTPDFASDFPQERDNFRLSDPLGHPFDNRGAA
jgi:response regulator RpfG family c-di-GMP phosphodiesterase